MKDINSNNALPKVKELLDILSSNPSPIDFSECKEKLAKVLDSANDQEIKIVLLGAFSDGKTSTIAGLIGEVMDDMKVDSDESSDEIKIYHPNGLKKGFVIIDTPGLFGTKEREIDGENVRFSDITTKYISEAHIVMYVTSAVAPIKESHGPILKKVLRDLGKLDTTIFILNKMDETGANITNEASFRSMAEIKRKFLIDRLDGIIHLTDEESRRLKVVCIAADPKRKGIQKWMETPERYNQLSRIGDLQNSLNSLVSTADTSKMRTDAYVSSIKDVISTFAVIYHDYVAPLQRSLQNFDEDFNDMKNYLMTTRGEIMKAKSVMIKQLNELRTSLLSKINQCTYEEMGVLLMNDIGVENDNISYYVVKSRIDSILSECSLSNESSLTYASSELQSKFEKQDETFKNLADKGIGIMKKVDNKAVLAARDLFCKGYKFKPWGAVKLANNIGKVAAALQVVIMAIDIYGRYKRNKQLKETKAALIKDLSTFFSALFALMTTEEDYIKNFAPAYNELVAQLEERKKQCDTLATQLKNAQILKDKVSDFYGQDVEYAEFEEL